jgi:hypothetical protein
VDVYKIIIFITHDAAVRHSSGVFINNPPTLLLVILCDSTSLPWSLFTVPLINRFIFEIGLKIGHNNRTPFDINTHWYWLATTVTLRPVIGALVAKIVVVVVVVVAINITSCCNVSRTETQAPRCTNARLWLTSNILCLYFRIINVHTSRGTELIIGTIICQEIFWSVTWQNHFLAELYFKLTASPSL